MKPLISTTRTRAASIMEVMIACVLIGVMGGSAILGLVRMNHFAALSRLQTGASTLAQNQIDLILGDGPFNPQKNQVPPVLTIGTTTNGTAANPIVPVYTDPKNGEVLVRGWMTTTVQDSSTTYNGQNLQLYRAIVTVWYTFRGKTYSVVMNTLRTADI